MNTRQKISLFLLVTGLGIISSCSKGFEEINTDPNGSSAALPEALLTPAMYDVVTRNNTRALRITHELMQDHVTVSNSDEIHRYVIRPGESDYMWNNWYLQLTNFRDMYSRAKELNQSTHMGMALICDAWVSSLITDAFGDVPYSESNKGRDGVFQPKFDKQQDIYIDLFRKLEEANTLLATNQALTDEQLALDPLYGRTLGPQTSATTISYWRKFGNSLYLRLLLRASVRAEANSIAKVKEIVNTGSANYPIFTSNAESAILKYSTTPPYVSAFNTYRVFDFNGDNGLSEFFINTLNNWNDPRRVKWATISGGTYVGIASGYPSGVIPDRQSAYQPTLMNEPLLGNIMNYPELQFLLAEAALKGYITGDPKTYYDNGVANAITLWGLTVPPDYFTNPALAWNAAGTPDAKLEQVHAQKYFTLFFTDFQQWFEYRRTGHPYLPKGAGLQNGGLMPSRLKYPVYVQSLNSANYTAAVAAMGGPDDLNTKVWWNK